jgi:hypothetical protein
MPIGTISPFFNNFSDSVSLLYLEDGEDNDCGYVFADVTDTRTKQSDVTLDLAPSASAEVAPSLFFNI